MRLSTCRCAVKVWIMLLIFFLSLTGYGRQLKVENYIGQAFRVTESFRALPNIRGAEDVWVRPRRSDEVMAHVVGERGSMYLIRIYENGLPRKGLFLIDKRWAEKTFHLAVVDFFRYLEKEVDTGTRSPSQNDCMTPVDEVIRHADAAPVAPPFQEGAPITLVSPSYQYQGPNPRDLHYHAGCEVLARSIEEEDYLSLRNCLAKLRAEVVGTDGNPNRDKVLCNLYMKLNPVEQKFAAYAFTAAMEAGIVTYSKRSRSPEILPPKHQELAYVMKVIKNRTRALQSEFRGSDYNELDVVLADHEFSPYNRNAFALYVKEGFWAMNEVPATFQKSLDYAVHAFIDLQEDNNFSPRPEVDLVDSFYSPKSMVPPGRVPKFAAPGEGRTYLKNFYFKGITPVLPRTTEAAPGYDFAHQFYFNSKKNKKLVNYGNKEDFPNDYRVDCGS